MDNQPANKQLGARYYQALSILALRSREDKDVANQLLYLLEEFSKVCDTEEEQQRYDKKYNQILACLDEYTEIEKRMFMISSKLEYKFKSFAIPTKERNQIQTAYRKLQEKKIVMVNASEYRKDQIARREEIGKGLDDLIDNI